MRRSTRNFNTLLPPGHSPGIWTLEDWIVQIPAPSGQNGAQMQYPIVEFVCKMLSSAPVVFNEACVQTWQHMSRDSLDDDAVYKNTTLIFKLTKVTWNWINYQVVQFQEASVSSSNSQKRQRFFNEGTGYISKTEPWALTTECVFNCSVSVDYLKQKRTALTMKWGCEKIPYCFHSIEWQRRTTVCQNSSDSSVTKRKNPVT